MFVTALYRKHWNVSEAVISKVTVRQFILYCIYRNRHTATFPKDRLSGSILKKCRLSNTSA